MENNLGDYRKSYEKGVLLESHLTKSPIELFEKWFLEVDSKFPEIETNAMTLSTLGVDGYPKSRIVLLKHYSRDGFIFYSNYNSEKGVAIKNFPKVCLSFHWEQAERQVIIKGDIQKTSARISDNYFNSRPRGSQLGALASDQSNVISNREILKNKLKILEKKYKDTTIDRPNFWGGYVVAPIEIEFWQGRSNRLHDRIRYTKKNNKIWLIERLSP